MSYRTVTCKCIECGIKFQSTFTMANCCDECWQVSITFLQDGKEMYTNIPKRYSQARAEELRKEVGIIQVCIVPLIIEAV